MKLSELEQVLEESVILNELSNDDLVHIIELSARYLNALTISEYAKANNLSYNGVKKCRLTKMILGRKFVLEND